MIVSHLIIPVIMIFGGVALLYPKALPDNDVQTRGFVRSMRLWGVLCVCYGAIDITSYYDHKLFESKTPVMVLLQACDKHLAGVLLGMILALIVSGQWGSRYKH